MSHGQEVNQHQQAEAQEEVNGHAAPDGSTPVQHGHRPFTLVTPPTGSQTSPRPQQDSMLLAGNSAGAAVQSAAGVQDRGEPEPQASHDHARPVAEAVVATDDASLGPSLSPSVLNSSSSVTLDAHPSPPQGPRYQHATSVMPKAPLSECPLASHQACLLAFSPGTLLGIRTLPNALSPDFKQQLLNHLIEHRKAELAAARAHPSSAPAGPRLAYTFQGGPEALGMPIAAGQRQVLRSHPYAGTFTMFDYLPSEYERARLGDKFTRLQSKLAQVTPSDFVVRSTPSAPKGSLAFSEFTYSSEPNSVAARLQLIEDNASRAAALAGPFVTAGRPQSPVLLRGRADECMLQLCKLLSADWPTSFMQVFEDKSGAIVVSFDRSLAVQEGDLSSYMQMLAKGHTLTSEFKLTKDGMQWGLEDQETNTVFYLFWPPWVRHRFIGMAPAPTKVKQPVQSTASMESSKDCQEANKPVLVAELMGMTALARSAAQLPRAGSFQLTGASGNSITEKPGQSLKSSGRPQARQALVATWV